MTPHRYLFDEHMHSFYPTLAERIGLNEAIVLQQIHSWFGTYAKDPKTYQAKHHHDGAWWIWNSYPEWHAVLPYFSESTIARTLKSLRKQGIVKVGNYNTLKIDRTYWYAIDYAAYDALMADQDTKVDAPSYQNDRMQDTNLVGPLPSSSPAISSSKEEPPLADSSPVEDSHPPRDIDGTPLPKELWESWAKLDDDVPVLHLEEVADPPEDDEFWAEGETPPPTAPQEPVEQGKARRRNELGTDPLGVAAAAERNREEAEHPDLGDASMDMNAWIDTAVREWARISGKAFHKMSFGTKLKLAGVFRKVGAVADSGAVPVAAAIGRFPGEHKWWAEKVGFEWPSDNFCNKLGMMLVPDVEPEPQRAFTFVDPDWLGVTT